MKKNETPPSMFEEINKVLRNLPDPESLSAVEKVIAYETPGYNGYENYSIFKIKDELYLKIYWTEGSYGNGSKITTTGCEIVKPTQVVVTGFEPIK
jgi:hypothetical protein